MRSAILTSVLGLGTVGLLGFTPAKAEAHGLPILRTYHHSHRHYCAPPTPYYNYAPRVYSGSLYYGNSYYPSYYPPVNVNPYIGRSYYPTPVPYYPSGSYFQGSFYFGR
jgi:hypothetical protein